MIVWTIRVVILLIFLLQWRQAKLIKDIRDDARVAVKRAEEAARLAAGALEVTASTLRVANPIRGDGVRAEL